MNSSNYLHALGNEPQHLVVGAVIEGNFHQPGSLVQANHACRGHKSSILAAGVDGLLVASESALNAGVSPDGPFSSGGDSAGCPLVLTGTDPATWTARDISITNPGGYAPNNILVLWPDCIDCGDVEAGFSAHVDNEPARNYGKVATNISKWTALPSHTIPRKVVQPIVSELPSAEYFEQQPTYVWKMPETNATLIGTLALTVDLARNPSLSAQLEGSSSMPPIPVASTIVVELAANLTEGCAMHFLVRSYNGTGQGSVSLDTGWIMSRPVNNSQRSWEKHSFANRLGAFAGGQLEVGVAISTNLGGRTLRGGETLATLSGFALRRIGAPPAL
eukprot:SAG31_NODE_1136_length_9734_cov_4.139595_3_plen_333_part_00